MPLCTLHLLALTTPLPTFLSALHKTTPQPLLVSRVIRWIITPSLQEHSSLLTQKYPPWTILLIYASETSTISTSLTSHVAATFTLKIGIPSRLLNAFPETNSKLLHPSSPPPALTGALEKPLLATSAQNLELTPELREWIQVWDPSGKGKGESKGKGAVSMLNLLSFVEGQHEEYLKYGKAFAESIGSKRGGVAKIVGKVVNEGNERDGDSWDEVALAHYPSIWHFADMAGSEDYQAVNHRHRVGSLKDTCILMTSELEVPDVMGGEEVGGGLGKGAKL